MSAGDLAEIEQAASAIALTGISSLLCAALLTLGSAQRHDRTT